MKIGLSFEAMTARCRERDAVGVERAGYGRGVPFPSGGLRVRGRTQAENEFGAYFGC